MLRYTISSLFGQFYQHCSYNNSICFILYLKKIFMDIKVAVKDLNISGVKIRTEKFVATLGKKMMDQLPMSLVSLYRLCFLDIKIRNVKSLR